MEHYEATCPPGLHVKVTLAELGRMRLGRCVITDHGYVGCKDVVTDDVQARCAGQQTCRFHVSLLGALALSCPRDHMPYLYAEHTCVTRKFSTSDQREVWHD